MGTLRAKNASVGRCDVITKSGVRSSKTSRKGRFTPGILAPFAACANRLASSRRTREDIDPMPLFSGLVYPSERGRGSLEKTLVNFISAQWIVLYKRSPMH